MSIAPFSSPGRFWRGNLHTHSTLSDGMLTPQEVCTLYQQAGYDFLSLTDHFMEHYGYPLTDTSPYRTAEFTTILGAELHTGFTELGHLWHILAVGLPSNFAPNLPNETGPQIAKRALDAGSFVAAAHPAWYGLTEGDIRSLGDIHAVEVFNATSIDHNDRPDGWYILDLLLMRGCRYTACATDDAHFTDRRHDALRGWVQVKSEVLEPSALLEALKAGAYYSSTGPQLFDIDLLPGDKIRIRCTPADRIFVTGYAAQSVHIHGNGLTDVELSLKTVQNSPYLRITVRDSKGGRAWSNPIWR